MNNYIFLKLNSLIHQSYIFDAIVIFTARYLQYFVILFALILMYRTFKNKSPNVDVNLYLQKIASEGLWIFITVGFSSIVSGLLKTYFSHPRPFLNGAKALFEYGSYTSFPSGHAVVFSALTIAMFVFHRKYVWLFSFFALIIGIARVISGVHYPLDIIAGYAVGALCALFICVFVRMHMNKYLHTKYRV